MGIYWVEIANKNQTDKQIQFLKTHLNPEGYILDLACGTGRHSIILSKQGYHMVGFDISPNLLKIAKQFWREVQLVRGDMRFLPFKAEVFSAAVSMDTSFGYLSSELDDENSLTELQRTINKNGILIIDIFNREKMRTKYQLVKIKRLSSHVKWIILCFLLKLYKPKIIFGFFNWKEYPSFFLLHKRAVNKKGDRLFDLWVIRDKVKNNIVFFKHTVRLFEFRQLYVLLDKTCFAVNQAFGGYEGENVSFNSPRLIVVSNRKH